MITPLAVGNQWEFRIWETDSNYAIVRMTFDTTRIVRDTLNSNQRWYIDSKGSLLSNHADGLWKMLNGSPFLYLKFPSVIGESYLFGESTNALLTDIGSTNYHVTVPSGNYNCYLYRFRTLPDSTAVRVDYIAVDKGLVKSELFERRSDGTLYTKYQHELVARLLH